jgi:nitroreductase
MLEAILGRRSVRDGFVDQPIPRDMLERVVECGLAAPSSKNAQPWRLHVVTAKPVLAEIADQVEHSSAADRYVPIDPATGEARRWESTVSESAEVLRSVAVGVFVENRGEFSGGRRVVAGAAADVRLSAIVGYGLEMAGIGAAIENMWIAASSAGLRGVFMGDVGIAEDAIRTRLALRGDLVGVLALGFGVGEPAPKAVADDRVVWHPVRAVGQ